MSDTLILTAKSVHGIQPTSKRMSYPDQLVSGLSLRVTPQGTKTWSLFYRNRTGKPVRWTIGKLDNVSLAQAREQAREALRKAPQGYDPAAEKQELRAGGTFAELVDRYIEEWAKPNKKSWKEDRRLLVNDVLPKLKHRAPRDVTKADLKAIILKIALRAPTTANRVRSVLHKLFVWAMEEDVVTANPVTSIRKPGIEKRRDRVISEQEIRTLWAALDKLPKEMAAAFKLRLITAQRGGEVFDMRWADLDLETGWWTIPTERSKNGMPHRVPLTPMALALLEAFTQKDNEVFVFAGARGKRQRSEAAATFGLQNFHGHDLRRTAASMMTGGGVQRFVVSRILNHAEPGVTAVYDRHSYDPEKLAALLWWDKKLTAILAKEAGKVLPFARATGNG